MAVGRKVPAGDGTAAIGPLTPAMIAAIGRERRRDRRLMLGLGLGFLLVIAAVVFAPQLSAGAEPPHLGEATLALVVIVLVLVACSYAMDWRTANQLRAGLYVRYEGPFAFCSGGASNVRWIGVSAGEYVARLDADGKAALEAAGAGAVEFTISGDFVFAAEDRAGAPCYRHPLYRPGPVPAAPGRGIRARAARFLDGD